MNTPLNDALPYGWIVEANDGHKTFFDADPIGFKHQSYAGLVTVHALYTRASTPESSAAQGAMTDEVRRYRYLKEHREVMLLTGFFGNGCINKTLADVESEIDAATCAQPSDATGQPINTDDMNDIVLRGLAALNEQEAGDILAEMDAAQPRADLTDEREAFAHELWATAQLLPNEGIEDGVARIVDLLANTAQGKPEHIADDMEMVSPHADIGKVAMSVQEALEFADEWTNNCAFYEGAQGWRVVCALLAMEVRSLSVNAGWLTAAHMICTDAGVPQGHIQWRMECLRELLVAKKG